MATSPLDLSTLLIMLISGLAIVSVMTILAARSAPEPTGKFLAFIAAVAIAAMMFVAINWAAWPLYLGKELSEMALGIAASSSVSIVIGISVVYLAVKDKINTAKPEITNKLSSV